MLFFTLAQCSEGTKSLTASFLSLSAVFCIHSRQKQVGSVTWCRHLTDASSGGMHFQKHPEQGDFGAGNHTKGFGTGPKGNQKFQSRWCPALSPSLGLARRGWRAVSPARATKARAPTVPSAEVPSAASNGLFSSIFALIQPNAGLSGASGEKVTGNHRDRPRPRTAIAPRWLRGARRDRHRHRDQDRDRPREHPPAAHPRSWSRAALVHSEHPLEPSPGTPGAPRGWGGRRRSGWRSIAHIGCSDPCMRLFQLTG